MANLLGSFLQGKVTTRRVLLESATFLGIYLVWLIFRQPDSPSRALVGCLAVMIPYAASAYLAFWKLCSKEKTRKSSWFFLGLALTCWLAGNFTRTYYLALLGTSLPTFSLADVFNLLAYPFLFLGLILLPMGSRYQPSRFRFLLDALISSSVIAALGWLAIGRPAAQLNTGNPLNLLPLAYPLADLVLLAVLFNTLLANPKERMITIPWGIGLLACLPSDFVYGYQALIQDYQAGGVESLGWIVGGLIFGLSVFYESSNPSQAESREPRADPGTRLQNILPVVLVLVLIWFVLADWRLRDQLSTFGLWMALVMSLGLIARLGIRAGEVELQKYWHLFRGLAEPAFICDSRGRILLANPALEKVMSTLNAGKDSARSLFAIFDPEGIPPSLLETTPSGSTSLEVRLTKSGDPYLLSLNPIVGDERKKLVAGVAYDIREQKKQQSALQVAYRELQSVSHRLEELNAQLEEKVAERTRTLSEAYRQLEEQNKMLQTIDQLKSDFVSMVSHELRTPLTSLNGGLELLLSRPGRRPEDQEAMTLMKNEVQRLTHFVQNILDLSVMEAGRLEARIETVDLDLVIQDVLRAIKPLPGSDRIRVVRNGNLPVVLADEGFLHSVLMQLLDNALKYAPQSQVTVEFLAKGSKVRVQVTDQGPGIPPEKRKFLFHRFERMEAGDAQSVYGNGLGLYLSRQLLRALKSDLHHQGPEGGGARFFFDLKVTT